MERLLPNVSTHFDHNDVHPSVMTALLCEHSNWRIYIENSRYLPHNMVIRVLAKAAEQGSPLL